MMKNKYDDSVKNKSCSKCGISFSCGNIDDVHQCWCNDYPAIFAMDSITDCFCPKCLKAACSIKIDAYVSALTAEEAMENKAKELPKSANLIEGLDYYIEDGKYIFKSWYHLKRGDCCKNGCRHCPYGYKKTDI